MFQRIAWMLAAALAFAGCDDRRAGTETGNPEITVSASVWVFDYTATQTLALNFRVMGMGYSIAPPGGALDSGKCWARPGGTLVDFTAPEAFALPDTSIPDKGAWPRAEIVLRTPDGPAGIPDSADIGAWSNPRYIKFRMMLAGGNQLVLFEMPLGVEYLLRFENESTESWRFDERIWIPFNFNTDSWTQSLPNFRGLRTRLDGKGARYLLLAPTENAAAWSALNTRMRDCFYADSVIVR
jgi:hypothetical protein